MRKISKKQTSLFILSIVIILSLITLIRIINYERKQKEIFQKEFIFDIILINNDSLNIKKHTDKTFVIYFADPDCDACKHEITLLSKKIKPILRKYNVLFITASENPKMKIFLEQLHIYPNEGIFIGTDKNFKINAYYQIESLPTILILDENFIARKKLSTLKPLLNKL